MHYTDLFIDFDDTIYDTYGNAMISLRELFDQQGLGRYFDTFEDFNTPYWQTNMELWGQYSRGEIDRDYLIVERFRRPLACGNGLNPTREYCLEVSDAFLELNGQKGGINDGARELLDYLVGIDEHTGRPRYRLHLCSNGFHEVQYKKLRASDTLRYFDNIILSEDAGVNKPHREYFDYALRVAGAKPETTLMIGDNYRTDILGARGAGIDQLYFCRWDTESHADDKALFAEVKQLRDIISLL